MYRGTRQRDLALVALRISSLASLVVVLLVTRMLHVKVMIFSTCLLYTSDMTYRQVGREIIEKENGKK